MGLEPGTKLGPYEITSPIGAGGMGEVYRARDTKLGRDVAIKVLPDELAKDKERLARFEREAKLLAQLNHPNVATLYGFEDGVLVMELVEGETLAERIAHGPIRVDEALPLFVQVAEGLEAAHEKGVIHRDLKPANVKITPEGKVKILDFGLAKAFLPDEGVSAETSHSPTLTKGTALGAIMGTAAYMSPEQAKGQGIDKKTDVWAFGCCLYEALTGRRPFPGDNVAETLARVIEREPDWSLLPPDTPWTIDRLLRRCLRKKRVERLRDIGDALLELVEPAEPVEEARASTAGRPSYAIPFGAAVIGGLSVWALTSTDTPAPAPIVRAVIPVSPAARVASPIEGYYKGILAISPDGTRLVFAGERDGEDLLYVREMDGVAARPLPGTSGAYRPFFSPDGMHVAFFSAGKLWRVPLDGGHPRAIADLILTAHGGTWGDDDTIVFAPAEGGLVRVSAEGGPLDVLTTPDPGHKEQAHRNPSFLPSARAILFDVEIEGSRYGEGRVMCLSLATGEAEMMIDGGQYARFAEPGYIVYATREALMAAPFDRSSGKVTGPSRVVVDDILSTPQYGARHFDVSRTGTLVYVGGGGIETDRRLVWVDRGGSKESLSLAPGPYLNPRLSPTGRYVSVETKGANDDTWLYDLRRGAMTRQTFEGENYAPVWSPDETHLVMAHAVRGVVNLHLLELGGSGVLERLLDSEYTQYPTSWSPDGKFIVYTEQNTETGLDLWLVPLESERAPRAFRATDFAELDAVFSPDSSWLAYTSNETGRPEVFVENLAGSVRRQASTDGGHAATWSKDGKELFYRRGDQLMMVSIDLDSEPELGAPLMLFRGQFPSGGNFGAYYDVGADGRFLFMEQVEPFDVKGINVVVNWHVELERLVPAEN